MSDKGLTERVEELEKKMNELAKLMFIENEVATDNIFGKVPMCARALNHADEALNVLATNNIFSKAPKA